jgi:hypothetical protein
MINRDRPPSVKPRPVADGDAAKIVHQVIVKNDRDALHRLSIPHLAVDASVFQ